MRGMRTKNAFNRGVLGSGRDHGSLGSLFGLRESSDVAANRWASAGGEIDKVS
jgi:hypothetical protein